MKKVKARHKSTLFLFILLFNIIKLIKNERGLFMELTNKKIALLQKIINAKLTKEELNISTIANIFIDGCDGDIIIARRNLRFLGRMC